MRGSLRKTVSLELAMNEHAIRRVNMRQPNTLNSAEERVRTCAQACCNGQQARCMPEPAGTKRISARLPRIRRHGPARPGTGRPQAAGPDILSSDASGRGARASQRSWSRLQSGPWPVISRHDLGGAADDRLDAARPPELRIAPEISGPVLVPARPGSIWSVRAAAVARCDLGGDHAPGDRLAAWQLPPSGVREHAPVVPGYGSRVSD